MINYEQAMKNIAAMKKGVIDAAGKHKGEAFIGRNIEVIIDGLFKGQSEEQVLTRCDFTGN